jgi:hypothetical protein
MDPDIFPWALLLAVAQWAPLAAVRIHRVPRWLDVVVSVTPISPILMVL